MKGSGFEDIVIEAGVCASGSLKKVMSGKQYSQALRVHKMVLEALKRLLFEEFQAQDQFGGKMDDKTENSIKKLSEKPDCEQFRSLIRSQEFEGFCDKYSEF